MKEYKVICISEHEKRRVLGGETGLYKIIEELTIEINRYLSNGATLNGGISICIKNDGKYIVSQAITITRYPPPDGDEEC